MKKIKITIALALMILVVFVAFGYLTYQRSEKVSNEKFDVAYVVEDLKVISEEHHSVLHPEERRSVRNYLYRRLQEMGGEPVICPEDSVRSRFGGYFDIANVYCRFDPPGQDTSSSYLMLTAHLDSRFPENVLGKQVCSYGAADDGYGLAVILELVRGAQEYASKWHQGLKVLFTDAEEHDLDGMRSAMERYNFQFDDVALVINVEARGVKGPPLLFETSDRNAKLMDFYLDHARYPYVYSLTSSVYAILPNFSDFTLTRTMFPGYNISVIDNVSYYHTDKDNFSNINSRSLAHYGSQLQPMIEEFLTSSDYADPDCFRPDEGEEDPVVFTVPGLCTFRFTKSAYLIINAVVFLLFCLVLCCYVLMHRIELGNVLRHFLRLLLVSVIVLAVGEAVAYSGAMMIGTPFSLISTRFIPGDNLISLLMIVLMGGIYLLFFIRGKRKSKYFVFEHIFAVLLLMVILSAVLLPVAGENFFLLFPVSCAVAALLLHMFVYLNIFSLPALLAVELMGVSFLYNLLIALTIGSLGIVMFLALLYLMLIVSLFECYLTQKR